MAKRIGLIALLVVMLFTLCACGNRDHWDTVYTYDTVIVQLADGSVVCVYCGGYEFVQACSQERYGGNEMKKLSMLLSLCIPAWRL